MAKYEDAKEQANWHRRISFIKSFHRFAASISLMAAIFKPEDLLAFIWFAGLMFFIAEILGVVEELFDQ